MLKKTMLLFALIYLLPGCNKEVLQNSYEQKPSNTPNVVLSPITTNNETEINKLKPVSSAEVQTTPQTKDNSRGKDIRLTPFDLFGMQGYIDENGREKIKAQFNEANYYCEGLAAAANKDSSLFGYINEKGEFVIKPQFKLAKSFSEGLACVVPNEGNGSKVGFIDKLGNKVILPQFEEARQFSDGLAAVKKDGKWGYINKSGTFIITPQYIQAESFINGLAVVTIEKDSQYYAYYIDNKGSTILGPYIRKDGEHKVESFSDGYSLVNLDENRKIKYGFIDKKANLLGGKKFEDARSFSEGTAWVMENGKYGLIDTSGKFLINPKYKKIYSSFTEGLSCIEKDEKAVYIDKSGKEIFELKQNGLISGFNFKNGLLKVKQANTIENNELPDGFINKTGKLVWPPQ